MACPPPTYAETVGQPPPHGQWNTPHEPVTIHVVPPISQFSSHYTNHRPGPCETPLRACTTLLFVVMFCVVFGCIIYGFIFTITSMNKIHSG